jgi:catechol 2,3-dioxygenase-like lactoylglutathione lyase family enzyme
MITKTVCCGLLTLTIGLIGGRGVASRQNTGPAAPPILTATGAFFALSVADAQASARWYSEKLGLKIVMQPPRTNQATAIILEGGGLIVELVQQQEARPLKAIAPGLSHTALVHGIFKAGVIVEDFDRMIAALKARNVPLAFGPFPRTAEQRANAAVRDNEGNLIQFFGK